MKIDKQKLMIIPADKTSNNYLVPPSKYKKLLKKEVQKDYKRESELEVENVINEHRETNIDLELSDRVYGTVPRNAFIYLKTTKKIFRITQPLVFSTPLNLK